MANENEFKEMTSPELKNSGNAKDLCELLIKQNPTLPVPDRLPDHDVKDPYKFWGDEYEQAWGPIIHKLEVAWDTRNFPNAADNLQGQLREIYRDGSLRAQMGSRPMLVRTSPETKILWGDRSAS